MKKTPPRKRVYRMSARAEAAEATRTRLIGAAIQHFGARPYDEVSLADLASDAGVTVQTVLRRFGSKEGLVAAAHEAALESIGHARDEAPVGDVEGAIENLMAHYEEWGDRVMRFLAQEERVPALRAVTDSGRAFHHAWVDRVFAPWIRGTRGGARARLRARLVAVTDVYVWKIMRRDLALDAKTTETSLRELVRAALGEGGGS